ncbi:hypothetical protein IQ255_14080 [Pleurocapsales cyanobacterium LEGE 10410]|nr:hypothetical protein [Pleurocapsales cyanobacterium LEGE 10410]
MNYWLEWTGLILSPKGLASRPLGYRFAYRTDEYSGATPRRLTAQGNAHREHRWGYG